MALDLLDNLQNEASKILAGGTDLMPKINARNLNIANLIYIDRKSVV